jgi:hypothetical protein
MLQLLDSLAFYKTQNVHIKPFNIRIKNGPQYYTIVRHVYIGIKTLKEKFKLMYFVTSLEI